VVKSFVAESRELAHFNTRYDATIGLTREQSAYWHRMDAVRRGSLNVIFFGIYAIIFASTISGAFTLGVMVLLIQLVALARQPVQSMSFLVDASQRAVTGCRDYFTVMDSPVESAALPAAAVRPAVPRATVGEPVVRFVDAHFGYSEESEVLRGVTFDVRRGERVAFVGESGVGKTTLTSLLLGLYPLTSGRLEVDGRPVGDIPLTELRAQVGVVFQDPALFSGTIRENIAYGRPDASEADLEAAARRAHAHHFILGLPGGYDAGIGERGVKLSGGQKQRIAVARALLKDAPILVLDEATSSLDSKAERLVQAGLEELMADRTTLIIAHRLSTISAVDRIITLRDGRIEEIGTPAELATTGGIYAELLALQASATKAGRALLQRYEILG
jgi:ATP-binding cassette subfamily B protein